MKRKRRYRKPLFWFVQVVLTLAGLEVSLRLAGLGFMAWQKAAHPYASDDRLRILALGESTTAADLRNGNWPALLQTALEKSGVPSQVLNEARAATTTSAIIERVPELLASYRPQIVISMMGVNDSPTYWGRGWPYLPGRGWFERLAVVKLGKALLRRLERRDPDSHAGPHGFPEPDALVKRLAAGDRGADTEFRKFLGAKTPLERARLLVFLGARLNSVGFSGNLDPKVAMSYVKESLELEPTLPGSAELFVQQAKWAGDSDACRWIARRSRGHAMSDVFRFFLRRCLPADDPDLKEGLQGHGGDFVALEELERQTASNHETLRVRVSQAGACLIAVQYPLRPVSALKALFKEPGGITFVANDMNFKAALRTKRYEDLFVDRFGGDFGHATLQGNQLIAAKVLEAVLTLRREGRCGLSVR